MKARREGLPVDAAFYYQLKACQWTRPFVIHGGDLPIRRWSSSGGLKKHPPHPLKQRKPIFFNFNRHDMAFIFCLDNLG